ncbi:MAG: MmcQ/YjbR family DNA-binding protein [Sulfitobacter sp.]
MLSRDALNAYCASLPQATHVVQWGGADVYKVGGKMFAIIGIGDVGNSVIFKATELAFEVLSDAPGLRPAPYMASRGLKWIQNYAEPGLSDDSLRDHIHASYDMIVAGLSRKKRSELGL